MGRHGRKSDLQARRPARIRPAAASKAKRAEIYIDMRIINTFNPRPKFCGRGFLFWKRVVQTLLSIRRDRR
jgi:hypothetical protein